jgi:carboxymethylenebutenolidase
VEREIGVYPNSDHVILRDSDPKVFKPEAAKDAMQRATIFFNIHLG